MDDQEKHTPGPYELRAVPGSDDAQIYSNATGECVASVHSKSGSHEDAPNHQTALHNAALFAAAPQLRESLETILADERQQIRPSTAKMLRKLLAEVDAGPNDAFLEERDEKRRLWEETIQAQIMEMSLQSEHRPSQGLAGELEEEEDVGPFTGLSSGSGCPAF